jgi:hypothetical protein
MVNHLGLENIFRVMVPAYDDPILWSGHSSMVHEIHKQLQKEPDTIFCSVGGGGLLGGIILGCKDVGWEHSTHYEQFLQRSYFKFNGSSNCYTRNEWLELLLRINGSQ